MGSFDVILYFLVLTWSFYSLQQKLILHSLHDLILNSVFKLQQP